MNKEEKLKIRYDYYKTWTLTAISLFMTSAIGIFTVDNAEFKQILAAIWVLSVILWIIFYIKMNNVYSKITI